MTLCDPIVVARQAPLSVGFSSQGYWSGLPCPPAGDLPDPGIEPESPVSPALAGGFFTTSTTWEARKMQLALPSASTETLLVIELRLYFQMRHA